MLNIARWGYEGGWLNDLGYDLHIFVEWGHMQNFRTLITMPSERKVTMVEKSCNSGQNVMPATPKKCLTCGEEGKQTSQ
jgi:hypothetical protein